MSIVDFRGVQKTFDAGTRALGGKRGVVSGVALKSDSTALFNTLQYIGGMTNAIEAMNEGGPGEGVASHMSGMVSKSLKESFQVVANSWAVESEEEIHKIAKASAGFASEHWTHHLYMGGDPQYSGQASRKLFEFNPVGKSTGINIKVRAFDDLGASYSHLTQSIYSQGKFPKKYKPWKGRAQFMLGVYAGPNKDAKRLYGRRTKQDLESGKKQYLTGIGTYGFTTGDRFSKDYSALKADRDATMGTLVGGITATRIMAGMDKAAIQAMKKVTSDFQKRARGAVAAPSSDFRGRKGPAYTAEGPKAQEAAELFSKTFLERIKSNFKAPKRETVDVGSMSQDELMEMMEG